MRKSDMKMCENEINKYTPSPETTVTHVIEIPPFPPEKRFLVNNLFSFSHFCVNIPPFSSHRSFYMFTRWVFSIPFGCPLLIASLSRHHHASERIYTYLCSVSLDDQLDIYHRSIRQTVERWLHGSHLPFKINGLTGVNGFWRAWFLYPPNQL